jgi:hypothetical protein
MRERGTANRGGVSACSPLDSQVIKLLPPLSQNERNRRWRLAHPEKVAAQQERQNARRRALTSWGPTPCLDHCLCIEDGIRSRRRGLILVTLRCCRCDQVSA